MHINILAISNGTLSKSQELSDIKRVAYSWIRSQYKISAKSVQQFSHERLTNYQYKQNNIQIFAFIIL